MPPLDQRIGDRQQQGQRAGGRLRQGLHKVAPAGGPAGLPRATSGQRRRSLTGDPGAQEACSPQAALGPAIRSPTAHLTPNGLSHCCCNGYSRSSTHERLCWPIGMTPCMPPPASRRQPIPTHARSAQCIHSVRSPAPLRLFKEERVKYGGGEAGGGVQSVAPNHSAAYAAGEGGSAENGRERITKLS